MFGNIVKWRIGILASGVLVALAALWGTDGLETFAKNIEARGWVGDALDQHAELAAEDACIGSVDKKQPDPNDDSKTVLMGWGWDVEAKAPPQAILLVDTGGTIAGVAQQGISRPDVPEALPQITSGDTGWRGVMDGEADQVETYALLASGEACPFGHHK